MPLHSKDDIHDDALDDIYASSDLGQVMPKYKMPELEHDPRHAFAVVRDEPAGPQGVHPADAAGLL